jgi:hypothetical protein
MTALVGLINDVPLTNPQSIMRRNGVQFTSSGQGAENVRGATKQPRRVSWLFQLGRTRQGTGSCASRRRGDDRGGATRCKGPAECRESGCARDRCRRLFENSYPGVLDEKVEPPEGFDSGSDAEWNTALATNLSSAFLCSQTAYPEMVSTEGRKGH